tara:strand:- start:1661 stop:2548 length:888 start_codon:yes stop_codon:yes gene_type:complete
VSPLDYNTITNGSKTHFVTLPSGELLKDAVVIEDALEKYSQGHFDHKKIFESMQSVKRQDSSKSIEFSESGLDPLMVMGDHPALHYRGNALKRHKIWLQSDYTSGMIKYGYTGWQHAISSATRSIESVPIIDSLMTWLNSGVFANILEQHNMPPCTLSFNHAIFTRYEDENDFIGFHSDKERDFEDNSYFMVIKLGATRDFVLTDNDSNVFWSEKLPGGTMVIVRAKSSGKPAANSLFKHGVPISPTECGPSGSIVFRCIQTVVPWEQVRINIEKANEQKIKRLENKRKRDESKN